jgi:hypothetical protein
VNACIFAGPTVPPHDEARKHPFTWLPPAQHGDVYRAMALLQPRAIGLVDGYFESVPSIWHKEILWAMRRGVHVFGAGSMGALRAAELASFGMRGYGVIFEAYRDGVLDGYEAEPFEDDDEVAVVHGPADSGYIAASEAMVNIRCTLVSAGRAGVVGSSTRAQLAGIAKALHFPERSYERLLQDARAMGLPEDELEALRAWLPAGRVNQKRSDALAMLEAMGAFLDADPGRAEARFHFEHTTLWERASAEMLQARSAHASGLPKATEFSDLQLLELTDWYFSRVLGRDIPDDLDGWVRGSGYQDLPQFHQAVFDEYVYRNG